MYELQWSIWKLFYKNDFLKKQHVYRNEKVSIVLLLSEVIIQTNLLIFRNSLNFTTKYTGVKLKLLVFFFVLLAMRKVQKVESIYYIFTE